MKKILALILAATFLFALAACTKTEEELTLGGKLKKQFVEIKGQKASNKITCFF